MTATTVTLYADTTAIATTERVAFTAGTNTLPVTFGPFGAEIQRVMNRAAASVRIVMRNLTGIYHDPVYVEGVKAAYYVRAALDPGWADPLSALRVLNPSPETWEDVAGMSREHRIEVAVAALRGHALHRERRRYLPTFGGAAQPVQVTVNTFTLRGPA